MQVIELPHSGSITAVKGGKQVGVRALTRHGGH